MADQQHGAVIGRQQLLHQIKGFDIQIVGRFIKHQEVAGARHDLGQQQSRLFTPRQGPHGRTGLPLVEQEFFQVPNHMFRLPTHQNLVRLTRYTHFRITGQTVPQRHIAIKLRARLVEQRDLKVGTLFDLAPVGLFFPDQHIQQRRLAHTIRPDQGDPIPPLDGDVKGA